MGTHIGDMLCVVWCRLSSSLVDGHHFDISAISVIARSLAHRTYIAGGKRAPLSLLIGVLTMAMHAHSPMMMFTMAVLNSNTQRGRRHPQRSASVKGSDRLQQNDWQSLGSGLQVAYMAIGRTDTHTLFTSTR